MELFDTPPIPQERHPKWFSERRQKAWETYIETPQPQAKDPHWRFSKRGALNFEQKPWKIKDEAGTLILPDDLPAGIEILTLNEALTHHSEFLKQYLFQNPTHLGSARYAALHTSHLQHAYCIFLKEGVTLEKPILIEHKLGDGEALFAQILIVAEKNAQVSVLERFGNTSNSDQSLCIAVNDIYVAEGARVRYASIQEFSKQSLMLQMNATQVEKDAHALNCVLNTGGAWVRNESVSELIGTGGHSDMISSSIGTDNQVFDQRTYQHHAAPYTNSDLLYKNTLFGKASSVFSGLIFVDKQAHYTDAYQKCRNLLMEDTAIAHSMPGLEINADQVKCSHGSTSATISDEEIFYLQARGIPSDRARRIIAEGFSVEILERIQDPILEKTLIEHLSKTFAHLDS